MSVVRIGLAASLALAAATLGGCVEDGYGYGGVSAGYGPGGYYDEGYAPGWGYGGYGYGYGAYGYGYPGYGWYDGFYYPGAGIYVYDRAGRRYPWNDRQRAYWEARRGGAGRGAGAGYARGDGRPGAGYDRDAWRARRAQGFAGNAGAAAQGQTPQSVRPDGFRGRPGGDGFRGGMAGGAGPRAAQGSGTAASAPRGGGRGRHP